MTTISRTYKFSLKRLILNSFFPLIIIIGHIFVITIIAPSVESSNFFQFIIVFVMILGFLSVPSLLILINFTRNSIGRSLFIAENSITLKKNDLIYEVDKSKISKIVRKGHNERFSRVPWLFMEHLVIYENTGKSIVVSSFLTDIPKLMIEIKLDRTLNSIPIQEENSIYELIK